MKIEYLTLKFKSNLTLSSFLGNHKYTLIILDAIQRSGMKCFWSGFTVGVGLGGSILFFYVSQSISVVIIFWVIVAILALAVYKS